MIRDRIGPARVDSRTSTAPPRSVTDSTIPGRMFSADSPSGRPRASITSAAAIRSRQSSGETLETTVTAIRDADVTEARMDGRTAFVSVTFVSEQINVTRDKDGNVVDGDPEQPLEVVDIWTFARNTRSRNPNWTLIETRVPT